MSKFVNFWKRLIKNDNFLKVISVVIAVILWFWVVSIAKPTNEKEFQNIPVQITYEGSTPDKQGLMMLLADTNITVNLTVQGTRSSLFAFNEEGIKVGLNFSAVAAEGTYQLPVSVSLSDENLKVVSVSPQIMNISFAKKTSKTLTLSPSLSEKLPSDISFVSQAISETSVTIEGPEEVVNSVVFARVPYKFSEAFPQERKIELTDSAGNSVDRTYLKLSTETVFVTEASFKKNVPITPAVLNSNGLSAAGTVSISVSPSSVDIYGPYAALSARTAVALDAIQLDATGLTETRTFAVTLPALDAGLSYADGATLVTITVTPIAVATQ